MEKLLSENKNLKKCLIFKIYRKRGKELAIVELLKRQSVYLKSFGI